MGNHFLCVCHCDRIPWLCLNCNISFMWIDVSILWCVRVSSLLRFDWTFRFWFSVLYSLLMCQCPKLLMCEKKSYKHSKSLAKRLFFTVYWLKDTHTQHLQSAHTMDTRGYEFEIWDGTHDEKKKNRDEPPERWWWNDVLGKCAGQIKQKERTNERKIKSQPKVFGPSMRACRKWLSKVWARWCACVSKTASMIKAQKNPQINFKAIEQIELELTCAEKENHKK